jgi:DNA-binding MarR family transcriptional regulator
VANTVKGNRSKAARLHAKDAFLAIVRTTDWLTRGSAELLKSRSLTGAQYNVLRILRGAGPGGLACGDVSSRLITREPDVTRLLDRLEKRGLIARTRSEEDRRVVVTRITAEGLDVLAALDEPVAELHLDQFRALTDDQVVELTRLLELVRGSASD